MTARLLACVAGALLFAACDGGARAPEREAGRGRVVLIGIDGATLRVIEPMLARGALPQLGSLAAGGVSGPLRSLEEITSPRIWNSVATGKLPEKHGIDGFARVGPDGRARLLLSSDRRAHALWNIASDAGKTVAVVNFWNTYPPEIVRGAMVSDHILAREIEGRRALSGAADAPSAALLHPAHLRELVSEAAAAPPIARRSDPFRDNDALPGYMDREQLSRRFEEDDALARMALALEAELQPDLLMLLLPGIDRVSHFLWGSLEPQDRYPEVLRQSRAEQIAGREALYDYYAYTDELLAAVLRRYGDDDLVIVLSDHGFEAGGGLGILTGVHEGEGARDGVVFLRGPGIPRRTRSGDLSVLDIAPTVLAWWGLPVGEDMDGRPAPFLAGPPPRTIASHDTTPVERVTSEASGLEDTIVEQLRSLGYIDDQKQFMRGVERPAPPTGLHPEPERPAMAAPGAEQ